MVHYTSDLSANTGISQLVSVYESKKLFVNKMDISFPTQLFIDGEFVDATSGKKLRSIDPKDESLICEVEAASKEDVDRACKAAHRAFTVSYRALVK